MSFCLTPPITRGGGETLVGQIVTLHVAQGGVLGEGEVAGEEGRELR